MTDEFDDDIHEVPSHTPDFRTGLAEELARLVPEAVADGKIDFEKLGELLDEDAGIFAAGVPLKGGLEAACRRVSAQHQGQTPMPVGLHNINEDWCLCPAPSEGPSPAPSPDAAAGTAIHCVAVSGSSSAAFLRVLDINNQVAFFACVRACYSKSYLAQPRTPLLANPSKI